MAADRGPGAAPELLAIGNCCADIFLPPHPAPPRGGIALIESLDVVPGGNGLNTAVASARLGVRAAFAGVLGDDLFGRFLRGVLDGEGVDVSRLRLALGRQSPATVVLNDPSGERSFIHHPGTNADYALDPGALEPSPRVFHLAAPELLGAFWPEAAVEAARAARAAGAAVSLDFFVLPGADNAAAHRPLLGLCDVALPNEEEALAVSGASDARGAARYLHDRGVRIVAIKRGERGALVSAGGRVTEVPARAARAIDTCGAGDNFAAGFLAAWLRGLDPAACTEIGCAMGTRCVEFRGSLTGTGDRGFLDGMRRRLAAR
jgi:sugar/nucleoside kinase (ribokinase family)